MSDRERLAVGLALSLAVHWLALHAVLPRADAGNDLILVADAAPAQAAVSMDAPLTLESLAPEPTPEEQARDAEARRLLARRHYLEQVVRAVHERRMVEARAQALAGNVLVAFSIGADGRFAGVRLVRGGGDAAMNADALNAVRAASGVVPRPEMLGRGSIPVTTAVKYQYGLE